MITSTHEVRVGGSTQGTTQQKTATVPVAQYTAMWWSETGTRKSGYSRPCSSARSYGEARAIIIIAFLTLMYPKLGQIFYSS
jgi:hypothetical protein